MGDHLFCRLKQEKFNEKKNQVKIIYYMFSIWPPSALTISEQRFLKFSKVFSNIFLLIFFISLDIFNFNSSIVFGNGQYTLALR